MKLLDDYIRLQKEILAYFGYKEDWRVFPLCDQRRKDWMVVGDRIVHGPRLDAETIPSGTDHYSGVILTNRPHRWNGGDYVMLLVDTRTDDNIFLMIFDKSREITDLGLIELYEEHW